MRLPVPLLEQELPFSCMAAAARMVLSFLGVPRSEEELRRLLKVKPTGGHPVSLLNLRELGVGAQVERGDVPLLGSALARSVPAIVFLDTALLSHWSPTEYGFLHAVVVIGTAAGSVTVNDPWFPEAPVEIPLGEFDAAWEPSGRLMVALARCE
jgi:ABC-type bacteriocin/lantibiotic exporter with double-glycine peptidase domain